MEIPDELIEALIPAVREQMEASDMPYVKETFVRLTEKEQFPENEALEMMAQILIVCANDMLASGKAFDGKAYREMLKTLPLLPDESE